MPSAQYRGQALRRGCHAWRSVFFSCESQKGRAIGAHRRQKPWSLGQHVRRSVAQIGYPNRRAGDHLTRDREVRAGKLDPKVAASITPLLHLQWQVLEVTTLRRRVAELEDILEANQAEQPLTEVLKTKAPADPAKPSTYAASSTA